MRYFWLIRHAHASDTGFGNNPTAGGDAQRELSQRGHSDGAQMVAYFKTMAADPNHRPTWLHVSAAARAQQTSRYVAEGFGIASEHQVIDRALYLAEPPQLLASIKETPADVQCAALVAHNPGLTWLTNSLADDSQHIDNLPTLGCALFKSSATDWAQLNQAELVSIMTPKTL